MSNSVLNGNFRGKEEPLRAGDAEPEGVDSGRWAMRKGRQGEQVGEGRTIERRTNLLDSEGGQLDLL